MLSPEELNTKIQELQTRHSRILKKKAELGGELKSKKDELGALVKEIQAAGYNPKTLVEDRNKAQQELEALMAEFEKGLVEAETSLSAYDKK
jgi:DNA repair exonuclease SbcCD ATPase subunit